MDKLFKYYLKKDDATYYTVVNGSIVTTTTKTEQKNSPNGWQDSETVFKRDMLYWGVFKEFSVPVDFVLESADILRHIYHTEGFEADCILYVEILNTNSMGYDFFYQGNIDFSTVSDERNTFVVSLRDRDISEVIASRDDTPYEIPLDVPEALPLRFDGVRLGAKSTWILGDSTEGGDPEIPLNEHIFAIPPNPYENNNPLSDKVVMTPVGTIQAGTFIVPRDVESYPSGTTLDQSPSWDLLNFGTGLSFAKAAERWYNLEFSGNLEVIARIRVENVSDSSNWRWDLMVGVVGANGIRQTALNTKIGEFFLSTGANFDYTRFQIPISGTLEGVEQNATLMLYLRLQYISGNTGGSGDEIRPRLLQMTGNSIFNVNYQSSIPASSAKGLRYIDYMKRLVGKMTDGQATVVSTLLGTNATDSTSRFENWDAAPYWWTLTCGNSLRSLPNSLIKATFRDAYNDLFAHLMVGMTTENGNIRIEKLKYFLNENVIATINSTNNMVVTNFTDKIYNSSKVGYGNYDNDNVEGKNEFNTGISYLVDAVKRFKKEDNTVSPFRSDMYGQESVRGETFNENRQDNRADNDTFVNETNPVINAGAYLPYRPTGTITGVDDPTGVYNITRSPSRATRRHLPRHRSNVDKSVLKFQTTDKNRSLQSNLGSGLIVESADIPLEPNLYLGHNVEKLFLPKVFDFDCVPANNLYQLVKNNPHGVIEFNYYGSMMKGYILELSLIPAKGQCRLKLLSHRDNDASKFIR